MAESAYLPTLAIRHSDVADAPRHPLLVRITHWTTALSFFALVVSGIAILVAHPRLYWGETGAVGSPSLVDLPLPFIFGPSGWGRYLHFLSAWVIVLTGLLYVIAGIFTRHFGTHLVPARADLSWRVIARAASDHLRATRSSDDDPLTYNAVQRLAYMTVIFVLCPLMIWTGLAMSPAITSVFPVVVAVLGGHQSARTIHFVVAVSLVVFLLVHVAMVYLAGFSRHMRAMITGRSPR